MKEKSFLIVVTEKDILKLKVKNINFLFPVKDFSVGFLNTYDIDTITTPNAYLYINRILDNKDIKKLEKILATLKPNIKGICFTDLGIINLAKKLKLSLELIYMQSHNTTNYVSVNYYLDYVDSLLVSTDITENEILSILDHAKKKLVIPYFSLIETMYSRRTLLKNYQKYFALPNKQEETLIEENSKKEFLAIENEYGTVLYAKKFIDYRFIEHENILYYFINPMHLKQKDVKRILEGKEIAVDKDTGFLHQETYYRLKEEEK